MKQFTASSFYLMYRTVSESRSIVEFARKVQRLRNEKPSYHKQFLDYFQRVD